MARPSLTWRAAVACAVGIVSALLVLRVSRLFPDGISDFDQTLVAARALLAGHDPYALIGPGKAWDWPWPFAYPLTAAVAVVPLASLPVDWARAMFAGTGAAILAYALTRDSWAPLTVCASGPMLASLRGVQWSPWLTAAMLLPALGWMVAVKPNVGLALLTGVPARRWPWVAMGAALLLGVAFAVQPDWALHWRASVDAITHFRPMVLRPGGVLLVLAGLRWRRPEARVLLAMAVLPGTPGLYDALIPLTAVVVFGPSSLREALVLSLCSFVALRFSLSSLTFPNFFAYTQHQSIVNLVSVYVPLLVAVLLRPNEGPVPAWVERLTVRWPQWVRGVTT